MKAENAFPVNDSIATADSLGLSAMPLNDTLTSDKLTTTVQRPDSLAAKYRQKRSKVAADTTTAKVPKEKPLPSPQRATVLSAVLPGLGQAYNGRYWKIPILYGAGIGMYFMYDYYNDAFIRYQEELLDLSGEERRQIESARDLAAKYRNYAIIGFGLLYAANIVDAMTDAHFRRYDISDDLSVQLSPSINPEPIFASGNFNINYGLSLNFRF